MRDETLLMAKFIFCTVSHLKEPKPLNLCIATGSSKSEHFARLPVVAQRSVNQFEIFCFSPTSDCWLCIYFHCYMCHNHRLHVKRGHFFLELSPNQAKSTIGQCRPTKSLSRHDFNAPFHFDRQPFLVLATVFGAPGWHLQSMIQTQVLAQHSRIEVLVCQRSRLGFALNEMCCSTQDSCVFFYFSFWGSAFKASWTWGLTSSSTDFCHLAGRCLVIPYNLPVKASAALDADGVTPQ